jgi:hypothetical protein
MFLRRWNLLHVGVFNYLAGVHVSGVGNLQVNNGLSVGDSACTFAPPFFCR